MSSFSHNQIKQIIIAAGQMITKYIEDTQYQAIQKVGSGEFPDLSSAIDSMVKIKSDNSLVTQADKDVGDFIVSRINKLTPHIPVMSEETPENHQDIFKNCKTFWTLDPIDGTGTFVDHLKGKKHMNGFGIHLGLVDDGFPKFGIALFPALSNGGVMFYTEGAHAYREDLFDNSRKKLDSPINIIGKKSVNVVAGWKSKNPLVLDGFDVENVAEVGGARLIAVAQGKNFENQRADIAYIDKPFSYWDVAASHAILIKAGGDMVALANGTKLEAGQAHSIKDCAPIRYNYLYNGELAIAPSIATHRENLIFLGAEKDTLASSLVKDL